MMDLEINASKSEVVNLNMDAVDFQNALEKVRSLLKKVQIILSEKIIMLGAPIFSSAIKDSVSAKHSELLKDKFSYLNVHQVFSPKNSLAIPKLLSILRFFFSYHEHAQAKLPVKHVESGLRSSCDLALPAYLSSRVACWSLISDLM